MCGIAGILSSRANLGSVQQMAEAIAHRGPDDQGTWLDEEAGVAFGHRRLAIVDLSPQGHQPMHSADGRFVICYNGEIYNHAALRRELEDAGHQPDGGWRGHSDTETLLQAIAARGLEKALASCAGMFAFALWDRKERRLHLVRDRFGEKPLYYGWAGGSFAFASELKAIRALPDFEGEIDRRALGLFAARTHVPAPFSIYRRIFKLEPGCILSITSEAAASSRDEAPTEGRAEGGVTLTRYWSYPEVVRNGLEQPIAAEPDALAQLESVLLQAVSGQAMADVPVGAFLSGGIDSSTIVALYQSVSATPVRTFTIGFEHAAFNEADHARAVAAHLGTVHHEQTVTAKDARDVIPLLPAIYDEPFADSSQIPTFLVSRFARSKVTVALTGDGGDELFGGYNRHVETPALWSRLRRVPAPLRAAAGRMLGQVPPHYWARLAALRGEVQPHVGARLQKAIQTAADAHSLDDIYRSFLDEWRFHGTPVPGSENPDFGLQLDGAGAVPDAIRMMSCDALTYLPDDVLCKVDRASMAVSLETRVPFLDHRVAELAARIPLAMKIADGGGKRIVRKLLARHLPAQLFERPKAGFAVPVGEWMRGPLRDWAEELLDPRRMREDGYFDIALVRRRWEAHRSGREESTAALWAVLMFQAWLRQSAEQAERPICRSASSFGR